MRGKVDVRVIWLGIGFHKDEMQETTSKNTSLRTLKDVAQHRLAVHVYVALKTTSPGQVVRVNAETCC